MSKYEPDKFIVINRKHLKEIQREHGKKYPLGKHPHIESLINALSFLDAEFEELFNKELDNHQYYVCNQDEPYAQKVLDVILEGEREKEKEIYCHGCSEAGGANMPIYHLPPECEKNE